MHFGKSNMKREYKMDFAQNSPPHVIEKTFFEKDLGIMISSDLKRVYKINKAVQAGKVIILK